MELGAIRHLAHDTLGRGAFASSLSRYIEDLEPSLEGTVIGLVGPWGSGKSSIIQMVLEELMHADIAPQSRRAIFHGDPGNELTRHRLTELAPMHSATSFSPLTVDLAYFTTDVVNRRYAMEVAADETLGIDLYRYHRLVAALPQTARIVPVVFQPWLIPENSALASVFIRELALSIGGKLGQEVADALETYRLAIEELAPIAGVVLDGFAPGAGTFMGAAQKLLSARYNQFSTIEERKSALELALRKLRGRKVVVVVDDLDRLTSKEAAEMVGLVKGLGRLPNVIYLLSYDEKNLSKLVSSALRLDGVEYLEKIVQYKRHVPDLQRSQIEYLFNQCLSEMTPAITGDARDRFGSAWSDVVVAHLKSPRDAIRLGNAFRVGWDAVGQHLDAADFLLAQFAALKDHELYTFIRENMLVLCGLSIDVGSEKLQELLRELKAERGSRRARLLALLFPKVSEALGTYGSSGLQTTRFDRRLSAYDFRHAYFDLVAPDGSITSLELAELVQSADPMAKLSEMLRRAEAAHQPSLLVSQLLDDLRQYYGDGRPIPAKMALALSLHAPSLIGPDDTRNSSMFDDTNTTRIESTIYRGLDATPAEDRASLLLRLIKDSRDLSIVAGVCRTALGVGKPEERDRQAMDMNGREDEVRNFLLTRIRDYASPSWVFQQANPSALLWFWRDSQSSDEVRQLLSQSARTKYYPDVVEAVVSGVHSSARPYYYEYIPKWKSEIADLEYLDGLAERRRKSTRRVLVDAAERYIRARQMPEHGPKS